MGDLPESRLGDAPPRQDDVDLNNEEKERTEAGLGEQESELELSASWPSSIADEEGNDNEFLYLSVGKNEICRPQLQLVPRDEEVEVRAVCINSTKYDGAFPRVPLIQFMPGRFGDGDEIQRRTDACRRRRRPFHTRYVLCGTKTTAASTTMWSTSSSNRARTATNGGRCGIQRANAKERRRTMP